METEKRKHQRVSLPATVSLSDQMLACEGDVVDVSMGGIAIERVPPSLLRNLPKAFTGVVSYRGKNVRISLVPRWYKKDAMGLYTTVGFKVNGSTASAWSCFVAGCTSLRQPAEEVDECVWSSVPYRG